MRAAKRKFRRGFSLIELVIVVVIIGIIAAIAIPKMSRGAAGAADAALKADMQAWHNALDLYAAEHSGLYPDTAVVQDALTKYTNGGGTVSVTLDVPHGFCYGPYLKSIPPLPVGASTELGLATIGASTGSGIAWVYQSDTHTYTLLPNVIGVDSQGNSYASY